MKTSQVCHHVPGKIWFESVSLSFSFSAADQMPEPPQLTPLDAEEQQLYSEPLPDVQAPRSISKAEHSHPVKEAHFGRLYSWSCSFGHYPELMNIGEGWDVDWL